jgi:ABC-2 type transport system ATP-binding protein
MNATIETHALTKRYGGKVAVDGLSIAVKPGQVTGFVGPNGAGKTTTLQILLGLTLPDAGVALIAGRPYSELARPMTVVGALLDAGALHPARSAHSHLLWLAQSNGIPHGRVEDVLGLVGLTTVASKRAGAFSLGMKQRLGVAAALLGDPPILILDEPSNGLDPEGIHWMRESMRRFAAEGRTVFVSSHLMSELEGAADQLVILGQGRLLANVSVDELTTPASGDRVEIQTPDPSAAMAVLAAAGARTLSPARNRVVAEGIPAPRVAELLAARSIAVEELSPSRMTLEDAYFQLTRDAGEHRSAATARERP